MIYAKRLSYLLLALVAGALALPEPASAAQQQACSTSPTSHPCGVVVVVGDAKVPCVERDGHAYCPVYDTYYPQIIA